MIRRVLAGLFAAALLVLAPSAAFAAPEYSDDDFDIAVSTTNPAPGETFTVNVTAPTGTDITLTVGLVGGDEADIETYGPVTAVAGVATFNLTLSEEGTYQIIATDGDGNVRDTIQIVVGDGGAAAPGAGDGDEAAGPALPETGATATPLIIGGALLLLVGAAALFFARRGKVTA